MSRCPSARWSGPQAAEHQRAPVVGPGRLRHGGGRGDDRHHGGRQGGAGTAGRPRRTHPGTRCHAPLGHPRLGRPQQGRRADNLRVRWINKYVRELVGLTQEQVAGKRFAKVFPTVAKGYEQTYLDVARTGEPLHLSVDWFSAAHVNGAFDVTVVPWGEDGLLIDTDDVTARRLAERALETSAKRLRDAQTLAGLGAWQWDFVVEHLDFSPHMFELLGLDPEIVPTPQLMNDLVHPEDREDFTRHFADAGQSDVETTSLDFRVVRPDGEVIWSARMRPTSGSGRQPGPGLGHPPGHHPGAYEGARARGRRGQRSPHRSAQPPRLGSADQPQDRRRAGAADRGGDDRPRPLQSAQ